MDMDWHKHVPIKKFRQWAGRIPMPVHNLFFTALLLSAARLASGILISHTGGENNSALVYVLAVVMISLVTTGYFYGILASVLGALFINYYFMFPYSAFSLRYAGYPVAMLSMLIISCVVCALTARVKQQATEAVRREKNTKALYAMNEALLQEKTLIQLQSARETIHSNILRALSHDLRTPLTAISGAASVLMGSEETPENNQTLLVDIKHDADALIVMVENLLSITRIQDTAAPLKKREEALEEVAGDAALTVRRRFPEVHVSLQLSDELLLLPMEPMLIRQVILNLLENAVRHSGDTEHIQLRLFRQDEWAVVEVRDRGCGLSEALLAQLKTGKPLPRDHSGDSTRGMGIGISLCQSVIRAHGGFFTIENAPEGGAMFRFGLPMEEDGNE